MEAIYDRNTQTYILKGISAKEAHIFIWGGAPEECQLVEIHLRNALVKAEDEQMLDAEYVKLFMGGK